MFIIDIKTLLAIEKAKDPEDNIINVKYRITKI